MGVSCPAFTDFEKMVNQTKPDLVIVTTMDSTHHEYIIKGLDMGCDVLTEKPLTTDEDKCQAILDAERRSKNKVIVGFNYRWGPYLTKIKGASAIRCHRKNHLSGFSLVPEYLPWCLLFQEVARTKAVGRYALGSQGHPPF